MAGLSAHAPTLRASRQVPAGRVAFRSIHRPVVVRADPGSKVVREYREDDDTVVVPGATRGQDGSLYADDSGPRPKGPTDNMSPFLPLQLGVFLPTFLFLICMSQQFHAWSHMKKSELPGYIVALQDANLLISRKAHGAHHKPNFEGNYCIVNGLWNPLLDSTGFFRWLEHRVKDSTGVEPRSWYPPEHGWEELVQPGK